MKTELKTSLSLKKTLSILSLICLLSGVLCLVLGQLLLPVTVATLAAIFIFEEKSKRYFGYTVSIVLVAVNVAGLILGVSISLFSIQAIIVALIIALGYIKRASKADCAVLLTVICSVFTVVVAIFLAMSETGEYTFDAAVNFYTELAESMRELFSTTAMELYGEAFTAAGINVTPEDFGQMFDSQIGVIISYIVIFAFAVVGLSFKLFGAITARLANDNSFILSWRFITTNVFAYFYILLVFASMFVTSSNGIFALTIANMYNIFMAIYAYIGFNCAVSMLSVKIKPIFAILVIIIASVTLSSIAFSILSMLGVLFTLRKNSELKKREN